MKTPSLSNQALIDAHIAKHGVKKMPTVAVLPTTATIPESDRAVRERHEAEIAAREAGGWREARKRSLVKSGGASPARTAKAVPISKAQGTFFPGPKPEMGWLPKAALVVDHTYQRPLSTSHVRKLRALFRWAHFQPLTVVPTAPAEDGSPRWAVIDGQHRLETVMPIPDVTEVPCYIVAKADVRAQAAAFLEINQNHRYVTPIEKWRAALAAGDEETLRIKRLLDLAGIEIAEYAAPMKTRSVAALRIAFRRSGPVALQKALIAIAHAWPQHREAFSESYISALPRIFRDMKPDGDIVVKVLRRFDPATFYAEQKAAGRERSTTGAAMVRAALEKKIGRASA